MIDANHYEIEFEGRLHKFLQNQPELADYAFVTKVYRCSAYAQLITDYNRFGRVCVGFKANNSAPPDGTTPTVIQSTGSEPAWQCFSQTGSWSTSAYNPSVNLYTPLATLRQIRPISPTTGFRNLLPPAIADTDDMDNYIPPWGELDEKGEDLDYDDSTDD
jgi:hypothetical protein